MEAQDIVEQVQNSTNRAYNSDDSEYDGAYDKGVESVCKQISQWTSIDIPASLGFVTSQIENVAAEVNADRQGVANSSTKYGRLEGTWYSWVYALNALGGDVSPYFEDNFPKEFAEYFGLEEFF